MTKKLETRCWRLKDYLEQHFESGKFITIEEICEADKGAAIRGKPAGNNTPPIFYIDFFLASLTNSYILFQTESTSYSDRCRSYLFGKQWLQIDDSLLTVDGQYFLYVLHNDDNETDSPSTVH